MTVFRDVIDVGCGTPADEVTSCVKQANSFREVVSLQAIFVTLTVALLAYVNSAPVFQVRVDVLFAVLALLPMLGLYYIVCGHVKNELGDVSVCTKPVRAYARQSMFLDVLVVATLSQWPALEILIQSV